MTASDEQGFTLVEVLVAFAVTGVVAAALLPAFHLARAREARSDAQVEAVMLAEARLQELASLPHSAPATLEGRDGRWAWRAALRLEPPRRARPAARLRHATIVVEDLRGKAPPVTFSLDHLVPTGAF